MSAAKSLRAFQVSPSISIGGRFFLGLRILDRGARAAAVATVTSVMVAVTPKIAQ
jgi:hypothetical protein